jgi:heterodisulfide reductase subunit B
MFNRTSLLAICVGASLVLLLIEGRAVTLHGQGVPQKSSPSALSQPGNYLGVVSCASSSCHGSTKPQSGFDPKQNKRVGYAVKQNEYFIWGKQDKHAKAYNVLLEDRSKLIARNMRLKNAHESPLCLSCHALPKERQARPLDPAEGISCEACHGPASGWVLNHTERNSHERSVTKLEMTDLKDPITRTRTCLGCHLGTESKSVDHELIAAGHPDLIFELDNFSGAMPPHWEAKEGVDGARGWMIGQVVSFREGLLQLARRARSRNWPDFVEMDCFGCHHALKQGGWRQAHAFRVAPGLPTWSPARFVMLRHIFEVFAQGETEAMQAQATKLAETMTRTGTDGKAIASIASQMADSINRLLEKLRQVSVDKKAARRLADLIAKDVPYLVKTDIRSAQQAVMAVNSLLSYLARTSPELTKNEVKKAIDQLYNDVESPAKFDPNRFGKHLTELQRIVDRVEPL